MATPPATLNYAAEGDPVLQQMGAEIHGYFPRKRILQPECLAGTWPAFWTLPDRAWPCPRSRSPCHRQETPRTVESIAMSNEHDITEIFSVWKNANFYRSPQRLYPGRPQRHRTPRSGRIRHLANNGVGPEEFYYENADTEYHTYGMYWGLTAWSTIDGTEVPRRNAYVATSKKTAEARTTIPADQLGWFFVLQEMVGEPRFGLDEERPDEARAIGFGTISPGRTSTSPASSSSISRARSSRRSAARRPTASPGAATPPTWPRSSTRSR